MTTITFDIHDEAASRLREEAKRRNLSVEQFMSLQVEKLHQQPENFDKIVSAILQDNAELYRRLA